MDCDHPIYWEDYGLSYPEGCPMCWVIWGFLIVASVIGVTLGYIHTH